MKEFLFTNEELNHTLKKILSEENLKDNLYLAGGISAYLDNTIKSNRKHHDFDFYANVDNMDKIRIGLEKIGARTLNDSLLEEGEEKGIDVIIDGIKAEIIPFELINNQINILKCFYKDSTKDGSYTIINNKKINEIFENIVVFDNINFRKIRNNILYQIKRYLYDNKINTREKDLEDINYLSKINFISTNLKQSIKLHM